MDKQRETDVRETFRRAGGVMRTSQALRAGVHPRDLYAMRASGALERLSRGVYRLADLPPLAYPDLVVVAARVPKAVVGLVSALHFHGLGVEVPHEVHVALPAGTARPKLEWPPLRVYRLTGAMFMYGIETHVRDGLDLRIYSAAKSVADCFRFRNRIGTSVAVDALRSGLEDGEFTPAEVIRAAKVCRVDRIVRPYVEALQ